VKISNLYLIIDYTISDENGLIYTSDTH